MKRTQHSHVKMYLWGARSHTGPQKLVVHQLMILLRVPVVSIIKLRCFSSIIGCLARCRHGLALASSPPLPSTSWSSCFCWALKYKYTLYECISASEIPLAWNGVVSSSGSFEDWFYGRLALYSLCVRGFVPLASKPRRCIDGTVNNGLNGVDANIIKSCRVHWSRCGERTAVFDVKWISPSWLETPHPFAETKRVRLNEVQINLAQSDAKRPPPFISGGCLYPSGICTKLAALVCWFRGSFRAVLCFQVEPVFPDWRMMFVIACISMLLWQITFEGNRLILCPKACFCFPDWPVVALTVLWKPAYPLGVSKYRMLCLATKQYQSHLLVSKDWEYTYRSVELNTDQSWAPRCRRVYWCVWW